jgi:hypothetical protein
LHNGLHSLDVLLPTHSLTLADNSLLLFEIDNFLKVPLSPHCSSKPHGYFKQPPSFFSSLFKKEHPVGGGKHL